ncbi:hypothetical protein JYG23_08695 [Sedimentibacter sp. zth1]|uniref:hypothetical protein n=1 Tax=Sedimentibacter sp. zth1 TaxID=2816908 RepID=UPI001A9191EB|nr:hypothetical protein [Sedimentibacter sp. zth1]QSX04784.1 hypothetical protein JYG23_08695 [Sedimentibacter sp. zth1]
MNKTISFCVKNDQGFISLVRILKIQPSGACYIDYDKKNNNHHLSLHTPNQQNIDGVMHIKNKGKIVFQKSIPNFYNYNSNRCLESIMIMETELRENNDEIPESIITLKIPKNHCVHILLIRSDKKWGSIKSAFISDKPCKQDDENKIQYPVFYSIEDMPDTNYYLTYNIQPISKIVSDYIVNFKKEYIQSHSLSSNNMFFQIRHPFMATDMEISLTLKEALKYASSNNT